MKLIDSHIYDIPGLIRPTPDESTQSFLARIQLVNKLRSESRSAVPLTSVIAEESETATLHRPNRQVGQIKQRCPILTNVDELKDKMASLKLEKDEESETLRATILARDQQKSFLIQRLKASEKNRQSSLQQLQRQLSDCAARQRIATTNLEISTLRDDALKAADRRRVEGLKKRSLDAANDRLKRQLHAAFRRDRISLAQNSWIASIGK